jgi:hypothetical protein
MNINNSFYLNICPYDYYGFCNQIYSICGTCSYAVDNNIRYIFIGKYRKQIKTETYCNISDIIDLKLTNLFLQKYNLYFIDATDPNIKILDIKYGLISNGIIGDELTGNAFFYIKKEIIQQFYKNNCLSISKDINLNDIKGNPTIAQNNLYITYIINDKFITEIYPTINGYLTNDLICDLNTSTNLNNSRRYNDASLVFIDILRNIIFNKKFLDEATTFKNEMIQIKNNPSQKINTIHLRLEDDAIETWAKIYGSTKNEYKILLENKYIHLIQKYIKKNEVTLIICGDYDNNVIHYLKQNEYTFLTTPKMDRHRDIAAITDLHIGQFCNNICIVFYESTFSFSLLKRIYDKTKIKTVMFEYEKLHNDEIVF